jgi:hypothetical protein
MDGNVRFPGVKRTALPLLDDHQSGGHQVKTAIIALAGLALAGIAYTPPAQAQGVPPGSYRQSCTDAHIERGALVATCRGEHGRETRSALADVGRCTGDIGNSNGVLQCNYPNGPARANVLPGPGYAAPQPQPGFGGPRYGEQAPGYGPREGYGERRYGEGGYGSDVRERCAGLHRQSEELRNRLERERDPGDRARIEGRLRELHEQEERCR